MATGEGVAIQLIFSTEIPASSSDSKNWKQNILSPFVFLQNFLLNYKHIHKVEKHAYN